MILLKLFLSGHLKAGDPFWKATSPRTANRQRLTIGDVEVAIEMVLKSIPFGQNVQLVDISPARGWKWHFNYGVENRGERPEYEPWYGNRWTLAATLSPDEEVPRVLYNLTHGIAKELDCDLIAEVWVA